MKKILALCWCIALCLGLLLYSLPAKPTPTEVPPASTPSTTAAPEIEPVRLSVVNTDPSRQEQWQQLCDEFSSQTGVKVRVVSDDTYPDDAALFTASNAQLSEMAENLLALQNTTAYAQLSSPDFSRGQEDRVVAVAADTAIFGLIYNETLLALAGYTRSDVDCFQDLKAVAEHITADSQKLGFGAFAKAPGNLTQLLSSYPADCRGIYDLYRTNKVDGTVVAEEAVFCLGSNLDFEEMSKESGLKLGMLPLYVGAEQEENYTFCAVTTRYWCIRPGQDESNQAAISFLNFLVSPRIDGSVPADDLKMLAPYRQAAFGDNSAEALLRSDIAAGKQCLICVNPSVPEGLMEALLIYGADPTDENWVAVSQLL